MSVTASRATKFLPRVNSGQKCGCGPPRLEGLYLDMLESLVRRCKADVAPVVIALGDMHRASPSALEAIAYMRQKLRELEAPVMFLGTTPDDSDAPGGAIRRRLPDATRIMRSNAGEVRELAGSILAGRPLAIFRSDPLGADLRATWLPSWMRFSGDGPSGGALPILTEHGIHRGRANGREARHSHYRTGRHQSSYRRPRDRSGSGP